MSVVKPHICDWCAEFRFIQALNIPMRRRITAAQLIPIGLQQK